MMTTVAQSRDRIWSPVLETVRAAAMDCLDANLALLADHHHGPGTHLVLGSSTGWDLRKDGDGLPTVETTLDDHLTRAQRLLGLTIARRWDDLDAGTLTDLTAAADPLYVVADAYTMPWLPYRGQRHMEHSFLLRPERGRFVVVDAYHNDTPWGPHRPSVWRISAEVLAEAVARGATAAEIVAGEPPRPDRAGLRAAQVAAVRRAVEQLPAYLDGLRGEPDRLRALERVTLDVWLLARARLLHAEWLADDPDVPAEVVDGARAHAKAWQTLASQTYVAQRRVARGSAEPPAVLASLEYLLTEDVAVAEAVAARTSHVDLDPPASAPDVRAAVVEALGAAFEVDAEVVRSAPDLRAVPGFSSFALVAAIERAEERLGVELDPDDLTPENLGDLDGLCRIFARAADRTGDR